MRLPIFWTWTSPLQPDTAKAARRVRLSRVASSAGGAVVTQFVLAGASLVLQAVAARFLGAEGFSHFVLIYGALVLGIALYTSWFGDALTVLDRFDPRIRAALLRSLILGGAMVSGAVAVFGNVFLDGRETAAAATVAAAWVLNESVRRIYSARTAFWALASNDAVGAAVTLATLTAIALLGGRLTLTQLFCAMAIGYIGAAVLGAMRQPREELRNPGIRDAAVRDVAGFAAWRSLQAGVRPFSLLVSRVLVGSFGGATALAGVEAARLLLAPALTVANGSGSYFLSTFASRNTSGRPPRSRDAVRGAAVLGGAVIAVGGTAVALTEPLSRLLTGGEFDVDVRAVLGWALYTTVFAATLPMTSLATARRRSRFVFGLRALEMSCGLGVLAAVLALNSAASWTAPYCLSAGGVITGLLLWAHLRRGDPQ